MSSEEITYESDGRKLVGHILRPQGDGLKGPFPAVIWNHGSDAEPKFPDELARVYRDRGFVFFFPVRRYHKPNVKNKTITDMTDSPEKWCELQEEEIHDVFNALEWL